MSSDSSTLGSIGNWFLEKGLTGVRKFYEKKIEFINKISNIKPEWRFYDGTTVQDYGAQLANEVKELETNLASMGQMIEAIEAKKYDVDKDDLEEIDEIKNQLIEANSQADNCITKIKEKADELVFWLSLNLSNLQQCQQIAVEYELDSKFVRFEIPILVQYLNGNTEAVDELMYNYYDSLTEGQTIEHPFISVKFAEKMMDLEEYDAAVKFMSTPIQWQPDNINYHKILFELYMRMGKQRAAAGEQKIINLLTGATPSDYSDDDTALLMQFA